MCESGQGCRGRKIYPYLLRRLRVDRPNQVWCAGITHLPMRRGFLYLVVIMDWHTRKVLAWRISNTLEAEFCVDALNEAIHKCGPPEIMNTPSWDIFWANTLWAMNLGSQFTSFTWTDRQRRSAVPILMDGKGRFLDNIFVERLWQSLKKECVYLNAWESRSEAKAGVRNWMEFCNDKRPHLALGWRPPTVVHWQRIEASKPDQQVQKGRLIHASTCTTNGE